MGVFQWLGEHWFDCIQVVGLVGSLLFTAYTIRKDAVERGIGNLIALNARHDEIWSAFYDRPHLARVLRSDVDLKTHPISEEESLFVKMLFIHLDTVRRTAKAGLFVKLPGLEKDIRDFMKLPIPRRVWEKLKPFQDQELVRFVDAFLGSL